MRNSNRIRVAIVLCSLAMGGLGMGCGSNGQTKPDDKLADRSKNGPTAQEYFLRGNTLLDSGDYRNAIKEFDGAIKKDPKRWDAYQNKAIALSKLNKFPEALGAMEQSLEHGGDEQADVYYNLGNVYQNRGLYGQAVVAYRAGLALRPEPHIDSLVNMGSAYLLMNAYDDATATFERIQQLAPNDPRAPHGLGMAQLMQQKYDAAIDIFQSVTSRHPDFALSWLAKGSALGKSKRYDEAIDALDQFLSMDASERKKKRANTLKTVYESELRKKR